MPARFSNLAINTILDTVAALMNGGKVVLYSGAEPATANAALSGNVSLADVTLANPAFGSSVVSGNAATVTANATTSDPSANANGTVTFFRGLRANNDVVIQGSVGTSSADMLIDSTTIIVGGDVGVSSLAISLPASPRAFSAGFSAGFS